MYFHHCVKLLTSLLELFLVGRMVWIGAHCTHRVSARFLANHVLEAAHHASLVFNLYMDWVVRVDRAAVRHWSLRASASLHLVLTLSVVHLPGRLQNLLPASATTIHGIVHHARLIQ